MVYAPIHTSYTVRFLSAESKEKESIACQGGKKIASLAKDHQNNQGNTYRWNHFPCHWSKGAPQAKTQRLCKIFMKKRAAQGRVVAKRVFWHRNCDSSLYLPNRSYLSTRFCSISYLDIELLNSESPTAIASRAGFLLSWYPHRIFVTACQPSFSGNRRVKVDLLSFMKFWWMVLMNRNSGISNVIWRYDR